MTTGLLLCNDVSLQGVANCQGLLQRNNGGDLKVVLAVHGLVFLLGLDWGAMPADGCNNDGATMTS
jgi:hypothetical protein